MRDIARCVLGGASAAAVLGLAGLAQGQPTVIVPPGFSPPGAWPARLSGAAINARNVAVPQEPDQPGEDNLFFEPQGSGPYVYTSSRNNGGDFGLNISPFDTTPASFPPLPANAFAATSGGTVYAWRPSYLKGLGFCVPRTNGSVGQFVYNGQPFTLRYTGAVGNQSSAHGYSMNTGLHSTGGGADEFGVDWLLGCAGIPDRLEGVGNFAAAYFPFEEGWIGGHVLTDGLLWEGGAVTPGLPTSVLAQGSTPGSYTVTLPGVNPATDGMVFVNSTQTGTNALKYSGAYHNGTGWTIFMRENSNTDTTGLTGTTDGRTAFSFVYVPYTACRLIGAEINGANGSTIHGAGTYTMTRLAAGQYGLTIPGKTDTSGVLVLVVSGLMAGTGDLPDRTFLSYQYDSVNGRFVIESREVIAGGTPIPNTVALRDSSFYFAWVDFANPMSPGPCACYANCDLSTIAPILNVNDFTCFLNRYAAGASYANCDLSTIAPVLNVNDFTCFINRYAAGCAG